MMMMMMARTTTLIKTMILVSMFHVLSWLPVEVYFLLMNVDENLPFLVGLYYAAEFIACLYRVTRILKVSRTKILPVVSRCQPGPKISVSVDLETKLWPWFQCWF